VLGYSSASSCGTADKRERLPQRRLITSAGPHGSVLKIRPPLVFGTEHADQLVERLDQVLAELSLMAEE
jgi:4-aminobutyrate aminotransferase-like enzyme